MGIERGFGSLVMQAFSGNPRPSASENQVVLVPAQMYESHRDRQRRLRSSEEKPALYVTTLDGALSLPKAFSKYARNDELAGGVRTGHTIEYNAPVGDLRMAVETLSEARFGSVAWLFLNNADPFIIAKGLTSLEKVRAQIKDATLVIYDYDFDSLILACMSHETDLSVAMHHKNSAPVLITKGEMVKFLSTTNNLVPGDVLALNDEYFVQFSSRKLGVGSAVSQHKKSIADPKLLCDAIRQELNDGLGKETASAVLLVMAAEKVLLRLKDTESEQQNATLKAIVDIVTGASEITSSGDEEYAEDGYRKHEGEEPCCRAYMLPLELCKECDVKNEEARAWYTKRLSNHVQRGTLPSRLELPAVFKFRALDIDFAIPVPSDSEAKAIARLAAPTASATSSAVLASTAPSLPAVISTEWRAVGERHYTPTSPEACFTFKRLKSLLISGILGAHWGRVMQDDEVVLTAEGVQLATSIEGGDEASVFAAALSSNLLHSSAERQKH